MLLVVQVDDYLYRSADLATEFELCLQDQFFISSTKHNDFTIMGVRLSKDGTEKITLDGTEKLNQIRPLDLKEAVRQKNRAASEK